MITEKDIRNFLTQSGLKQGQLAEMLGVSQPTVSRWLKGSIPEATQQEALRRLMEVPAPKAVGHQTVDRLNPNEMPVYSAVEGGPGAMVVSNDPVDKVARPYYLMGIKDAFGVIVVGESMEPKYEPGDVVFVNPRYPAVRGRPAIFIGGEAEGEFRATIKMLVRQTEQSWRVQQFNPPKEFDLSRKEWPKAWRVAGSKEGG